MTTACPADGNTVHNSATTPPYYQPSPRLERQQDSHAGADQRAALADIFVSTRLSRIRLQSNKDIQPIASGAQHRACDPINNPLNKDDLRALSCRAGPGARECTGQRRHQVLYPVPNAQ
jgi:hypothetical protein